jgi:magnesium chelatase subunit I
MRLTRGILARAARNLLYIDEVNLLDDTITDCILDAAASGIYTVRRGPLSATYRARFSLVGSMNPEEGNLRPQIMDRFGLRVIVEGLSDPTQRLEAYRRTREYQANPRRMAAAYAEANQAALMDITAARSLLPDVQIRDEVAHWGIHLVRDLKIDSMRAEITLFEAGRAYAAAEGRTEVTIDDLQQLAPMALRLRRSEFMPKFIETHIIEDENIRSLFNQTSKSS